MLGLPLLRPAFITCLCFMVLVVVAEIAISAYSAKKGEFGFVLSSLYGYFWCGVLWLISFTVALGVESWLIRMRLVLKA
jgi:hypothetical protein